MRLKAEEYDPERLQHLDRLADAKAVLAREAADHVRNLHQTLADARRYIELKTEEAGLASPAARRDELVAALGQHRADAERMARQLTEAKAISERSNEEFQAAGQLRDRAVRVVTESGLPGLQPLTDFNALSRFPDRGLEQVAGRSLSSVGTIAGRAGA